MLPRRPTIGSSIPRYWQTALEVLSPPTVRIVSRYFAYLETGETEESILCILALRSFHLADRVFVLLLVISLIVVRSCLDARSNRLIQKINFNCAKREYKGLRGAITSGSQKSPTLGGQFRERSVKISRKPLPVCSVEAPNVICTLLIKNGR